MNFNFIAKQSITALMANKTRSALSLLGIIIGVAAVVIILSLGQGLKGLVTKEVEAFGQDVLDIAVRVPGADEIGSITAMARGIKITTLKTRDIEDLKDKERFPYIEAVTGQAFAQGWAVYKNQEKQVLVYGCSPDFLEIFRTVGVAQGRFFNENENKSLAQTAVLGNNLAEELFRRVNPIGKKIRLEGKSFEVIGVLEPYGGISFGGVDINDFVYLPLETTLKQVLGIDYLSEIALTVKGPEHFPRAIEEISRMLRRNHNISDPSKDDFQITTMEEILNRINEISFILNLLLGFLAAISLLVGGIGIMNIMLVSVSERTKEIGLRKAVGARRRDVLWQFLIESLLVTSLGGFIGALLGVGSSVLSTFVIRSQGINWPLTISWLAIIVAFLIATAIGLIFGVYPARKASRLSPINALRKE